MRTRMSLCHHEPFLVAVTRPRGVRLSSPSVCVFPRPRVVHPRCASFPLLVFTRVISISTDRLPTASFPHGRNVPQVNLCPGCLITLPPGHRSSTTRMLYSAARKGADHCVHAKSVTRKHARAFPLIHLHSFAESLNGIPPASTRRVITQRRTSLIYHI